MIPEKVISGRLYTRLILLANLFFIAVWYLSNQGLSFWDDFTYLNFANELNEGRFEITDNHFTSRITLIYPVAYVIKYLGISQYTMVVFPLLCGLVLLNTFLWLGHRVNRWIGVIGGLLILCNYHLIYFSNHLFPEMPLALSVFLCLMGYYMVLKDEMVPRMAGLLSALALFAAFLTKTTVVLLLPLLLYLFINDRLRKRNGSFWLVFVSLSIFFFLLNGFWYMEVKGSFFYRFQNIANNHVPTAKTFFDKDGEAILARLTYLPLLGFLKGGFFIPLLLALPSVFKLKKASFKLKRPEDLWPVTLLFLLLAFWFFSTSWRYYSPLPTENRHIVYFIPIMIMCAATFWPFQKPFDLLRNKSLAILLVLAFVSIPVYAILQSGKKQFKAQEELIQQYVVEDSGQQLVITDGLTTYGHAYFYGFGEVNDDYMWFSEPEPAMLKQYMNDPGSSVWLLVNRAYFNEEYDDTANLEAMANELGVDLQSEPLYSLGAVQLFEVKRP